MPIIGAHVSAAGGAFHCFKNAEDIGAQAIQIFGASPRQWSAKIPDQKAIDAFQEAQKASGLGPVFLHAAYLVNLCTPKDDLFEKSITNLAAHLQIAELLGAQGLVFHIGSSKGWGTEEGIARVAEGMQKVLKMVPGKSQLIMENAAGGGDKIGSTMEQIGQIFHKANHPRVKVCLDTQHAFAAGVVQTYSEKEVDMLASECDAAFGLENLVVLHVNDSKTASGSLHDRHENIGEGEIGKQGFQHLAAHTAFRDLPWILEVPGFDGGGPDKKNIDSITKVTS